MIKRELDVQGIGMTSQRTRNRLVEQLKTLGITHEGVLKTLAKTPRHLFVEEAFASRSYENTALPIGHGQTISQPYSVARMTELLLASDPLPKKVLEVGTGSGYQAAVLAALVDTVYTVERIEALHSTSRELLDVLGYKNIKMFLADGGWGLPQHAPFDAIIVTAAPESVPDALLQQLAIGGKLIIPVGVTSQILQCIVRVDSDKFVTENHESVLFVPLVTDSLPTINKK